MGEATEKSKIIGKVCLKEERNQCFAKDKAMYLKNFVQFYMQFLENTVS